MAGPQRYGWNFAHQNLQITIAFFFSSLPHHHPNQLVQLGSPSPAIKTVGLLPPPDSGAKLWAHFSSGEGGGAEETYFTDFFWLGNTCNGYGGRQQHPALLFTGHLSKEELLPIQKKEV